MNDTTLSTSIWKLKITNMVPIQKFITYYILQEMKNKTDNVHTM